MEKSGAVSARNWSRFSNYMQLLLSVKRKDENLFIKGLQQLWDNLK